MKKIFNGFKKYLTDWKNLLTHALVGIGLLVIAIWAPISTWVKISLVLCLIIFNLHRMYLNKNIEEN